jgi:glutathione S-transferase
MTSSQREADLAHVRGLAQMLAMDAHPFIVPRVRKYLEQELRLDEPARMKWLRHWLDAGSRAIEEVLARDPRTGRFCYGDRPTIADICLVAHLTMPRCYVNAITSGVALPRMGVDYKGSLSVGVRLNLDSRTGILMVVFRRRDGETGHHLR